VDLSNISIIPLLPPNLAKNKNVRSMCEAFDKELQRVIADIPGIEILPDLARKQITDNLLLDLLAWQFHCDFYSTDFTVEQKQEIILKSLDWHTRKGTPSVIEEVVSTVFARAEVKEWFEYGGLPYRFIIGINEETPTQETRDNLIRAIGSVKNARSFLEKIITILYHEDEFHMSDSVQIKPVRRDIDVYPGGLRYDGRWKYDHGEFLKLDGSHKYDGTWPYDLFIGKKGTVTNVRHIPSYYDGTWVFGGDRIYSGDSLLNEPEDLPNPVTFNSQQRDEMSAHLRLAQLEDACEIAPRYDGTLVYQGWRYGAENPSMIDSLMEIKITRNFLFNGRWAYWGRSFDGSWKFDGSLTYSSGITYSGKQVSMEVVV
jgi:phage tail P2-like protein